MAEKLKLRIVLDDMGLENPRDWDNTGIMTCWHGRYDLGDIQPKQDPMEFEAELPKGTVILPLYLYDHSGITMNTTGFSCPWDSGQVGIIYCTPEMMEKQGIDAEGARLNMESEVEIYDMYLRGDIYGFIVEKDEGCCSECGCQNEPEVVASCFGFYGNNWKENGLAESLPEEVLPQLETVEIEYP